MRLKKGLMFFVNVCVIMTMTLIATSSAYAAARPSFTYAEIENSKQSTVDISIYGAHTNKFVNSNSKNAIAVDLEKITYNGEHPVSAKIVDLLIGDKIVATFPITVGTGKSGGSLTISAGCVKNSNGENNKDESISNDWIADKAKPQVALSYSKNPVKAGTMTITATYTEKVCELGLVKPKISINQQGSSDISNKEMSEGANKKIWTYNYQVRQANGSNYKDGEAVVSLSAVYDSTLHESAAPSNTKFTIDTTAPVVTGVENGKYYNNNRTPVFNEGTAKLNGNSFTSGTAVSAEGSYTLVVTDAAGNVTTVSFTIDKTAPVVTGVTNNAYYNTDVTPEFNEGTAKLNGSDFTSGTKLTLEGSYTLVVTDNAGNVTTVTFTIDKTAPVVTGVTDGGLYNYDVTPEFNEGTATLNGSPFTSGTTVSADNTYTLIVTDRAGNTTTVVFTIDKTAPTVGITYSTNPAKAGNLTITATYSELVRDGDTPQISINQPGTTDIRLQAMIIGSDRKIWTYVYTVNTANGAEYKDGTAVISLAAVHDAAGNSSTQPTDNRFKIDTKSPAVGNVTAATANGIYNSPDVIHISVKFSEVVKVTGTPRLLLETGDTDRYAVYVNGDGTNALKFDYTVQPGDNTPELDYVSSGALELNGGTISDTAGNNALLALPVPGAAGSLSANKDIAIDTIAPTVELNFSKSPAKAGDIVTITAAYTESLKNGETPKITINQQGSTDVRNQLMTQHDADRKVWTYEYTVNQADGRLYKDGDAAVTLSVVHDAAGNAAGVPASNTFIIDTTAPTVTLSHNKGSLYVKKNDSITITAEFNENMSGTPKITVNISGIDVDINNADMTGSGSTWTYVWTVPSAHNGTAEVTVAGADIPGNNYVGTDKIVFNIDNRAPLAPNAPVVDSAVGTVINSTEESAGFNVTVDLGSSEASAGDTLELLLDNKVFNTPVKVVLTQNDINNGYYTFTIVHGQLGTDGQKEITARVTDISENEGGNSQPLTLTLDTSAPGFTIQYYLDENLTNPMTDNPWLKAGTYYLVITANEELSSAPTLSIDAEGTANDVTDAVTTLVGGKSYLYIRGIANDAAAVGSILEDISITAADTSGNTASNSSPSNEGNKAGYTDTKAPVVSGVENGVIYNTSKSISFDEGNAVLNGSAFTSGNEVVNAGDYNLVVTDRAGNVTDIRFTIVGLNGLTTSEGTLVPVFHSNTELYSASVGYEVYSVKLTPATNVNNAIIKVKGEEVVSGTASNRINLDVGDNLVDITVIGQDGVTTRGYSLTVVRGQPSTDASLSNLTVNAGDLVPLFNPAENVTEFSVSVAYSVYDMTVTPSVNEPHALVKVNGLDVVSGTESQPINLNVGDNTINVDVTAQDGITAKNYKITVVRGEPNQDATLGALTVSAGELIPVFNQAVTEYAISVDNSVYETTIKPVSNGYNAVIRVNGLIVSSGFVTEPINLVVGTNTINIEVTAEDGVTVKTYVVRITRAAPAASSDASLAGLTLSAGTLNPGFSSGTLNYTVEAAYSVSSITITPSASEASALITVNGSLVANGSSSQQINLQVGDNDIVVRATAPDGVTVKEYKIKVTRLNDAGVMGMGMGDNYIYTIPAPAALEGDPTVEVIQEGSRSVVALNITVEADNKGSANISSDLANKILDKIGQLKDKKEELNKAGTANVETRLIITVESSSTTGANVNIPQSIIESAKNNNVDMIEVSTPIATVIIPPTALISSGASTINIETKVADKSTLTDEQKAAVGDKTVYDFNVIAGTSKISNFGTNIEVAIPYTLKEGEDPNNITVYFVNDNGQLENMQGAYDPDTKTVRFYTNHFSKYIIKSNAVTFNDLAGFDWAKMMIEAMAAKGVINGKAEGVFKPGDNITRAEFASLLVRMFRIEEVSECPTCMFSDVKAGAWYEKTVMSAAAAGIVTGYTDGTFKPDGKVTRQEMAVMIARVLNKYKGAAAPKNIDEYLNFTDNDKLAEYAKDSVALVVKYGIMKGGSDKKFRPEDSAIRAEAAVVMYNISNLKE